MKSRIFAESGSDFGSKNATSANESIQHRPIHSMKSALFSLLALTAIASAVERPKGIINLPWGASPEEAKRTLSQRPGVTFPENTDDYHMEPTGGTFAGLPVAKWILDFPERKFASASIVLKLDGGAQSVYKDFRAKLGEKYGTPTTEKKLSGGGKAVRPANYEKKQSFGSIATWKFVPTMKEKESLTVVAELSDGKGNPTGNEDALVVTIRYSNDSLVPKTAEGGKSVAPVKKEDL
jgi:hypothetical protein